MGVEITSFDEIPQETVDQMYDEAAAMMREKHPEVELARGPFSDLVLYFMSVINAGRQVNITRLRQSMSLLKINENPDQADPDTVDDVLSNAGVTRLPGTTAAGDVTIIVGVDNTVVIPANMIFTANGAEYATPSAFTARPSTSTAVTDTDRVLSSLGDGTYAFTIPLNAVAEGSAGNIRRGTKIVPSTRPENFVRAYAASDFSGGKASETNAELLEKMAEGQAAKSMGGALSWQALIKQQPAFERVLDVSIRGYGDPEQMRDQHGIIPISSGGRVDIYARTAELPVSQTLTITCTYIDDRPGGTAWQFELPADLVPGFYQIEAIRKLDDEESAGYTILLEDRGFDLDREGFIPDIVSREEAAYTRFQTCVCQFLDTDTTPAGLVENTTTAEYSVTVLAMPLIAELQDFVGGRDHRCKPTDVLVKAVVPCFLTASLEIRRYATDGQPDTAAIAAAVAAAVNTGGRREELHASTLIDVVHGFLTGRAAVAAIDLQGRIRAPSGESLYVHGVSTIEIPNDPLRMVTGETTAFILDPQDVAISVITVG